MLRPSGPAPATIRRHAAPGAPSLRHGGGLVRGALLGVVSLGVVLLGGCGEDQTGQPGIPEVDFTPRLVVTVDDDGLAASIGPRGEGDDAVGDDPGRMPVPGVIELRFVADGEQRVVGYLTPPGEQPPDLSDRDVATPTPLVDSGIQLAGDTVTVVLEDPGTLELSTLADPDQTLPITLEPSAR